MRHLFILNPAAGKRGTTKQLEGLLDRLRVPHEVVYTGGAGDAERFAREAAAAGAPVRIYACGGDGTLNEVVNGAAGYENAAVTNVPKGTGNDFLKIFGPDYRKIFYDLEALAQGPQTAFDLIDCNGRLGIDVVCAGVDARIAADVHRYKDWPLVTGKGAYRESGRYYGGGFMPVGDAMPDDGVLDMLRVRQISLWTFLRLVGQYAKGRYREYPELIDHYHGQRVEFSALEPITVVVDGEVMRDTRFTVRLSEKKINFFYPAGADYRVKD